MKRAIYITISLALVISVFISELLGEGKPFYQMSNQEIDSLLTIVSVRNLTITDRMSLYSEKFLGMPYNQNCTGDSPYALYEPWPLVNFKETNCMVFCEHVLALSISDSWDNFFNNLQQIRYQDGIIGMRTRNHYTMADWLPENSWLLEDVSHQVGGQYIQQMTRTILHRKFFEDKGIADLRYVKPDRTITLEYLPKEYLFKVENNICNGDILVLIFANKSDIFSAHMLISVVKNGKLFIRESSSRKMTTCETPFTEWGKSIQSQDQYAGLCFIRIRAELNTPGRIILPWEITELKKNHE
ncbi:MAG: DUF1460 domain-containing protein [Candidatus Marinimicrobia bacterium]|nr:DUF1460 domain-containing protein [Candidatus Neomarinimicrobiota bacterium]